MASEPTPHSKPNHVTGTTTREKGVPEEDILYPQGLIAGLPEEFDSRRERFAELDSLQPGWTLELRKRRAGSAVDAVFFSPDGMSDIPYMMICQCTLKWYIARSSWKGYLFCVRGKEPTNIGISLLIQTCIPCLFEHSCTGACILTCTSGLPHLATMHKP